MEKIYREEQLLRTCDCDMTGAWRPSAVLETMQEAAGAHSQRLGCGRDRLIEKKTVWVLTRCEVRMDACPRIGERVLTETFPMPLRRWLFPRYFVFRDAGGRALGAAGTLWALFDLESRRMAAPGEVAALLPDNADLVVPMEAPGPVTRLEGEERTLLRAPAFSDIDVNGHVNNTRYADWLCDALGVETLKSHRLRRMKIQYAAEVRPEQEMLLRLVRSGLTCYLAGSCAGKTHFEIGAELTSRT